MKLRWSSIDGTSWRAMTDNGFIGNVVFEEETGFYSLTIICPSDHADLETYEDKFFSRHAAEVTLLERAGLL